MTPLLYNNGLVVTEKLLEHFLMPAFFHHNITQDFPFDFLLFLKSKLKSQKWRKYVPLYSPDEILASVFIYTCSQLPEPKTTQAENEI